MKNRNITVKHGQDGYTLIIIDGVTIPVQPEHAPVRFDSVDGGSQVMLSIPAADDIRLMLGRTDAQRLSRYITEPDGGDDGLGIEPADEWPPEFLDFPADADPKS